MAKKYSMNKSEKQMVKPASNNAMLKLFKIILFTCAFLVWGMAVSVQYSTYADLRIRLNITVNGIAYALAIGCMGKICGGVFSVITDRFGKASDMALALMIALAACTFLFVPFCRTTDELGLCFMMTNLGFYFMKSAVHSQITSLWSTGGKPARYIVHLGFSIGLALGTFLSKPFTSGVRGFEADDSNHIQHYADAIIDVPAITNLTTTQKNYYAEIIKSPSTDQSTIEYAYIVVFTLSLLVASSFVLTYFLGLLSNTLYKLEKPNSNHTCLSVISPRAWAADDVRVGVVMSLILVVWTVLQNLMNFGTDTYLQRFAMDSELGFESNTISLLSLLAIAGGALGISTGMIFSRVVSIRYILIVVAFGQTLFAVLCLLVGSGHMTSLMALVSCLYFFRDAAMPTIYAWSGHYILIYGVLIGLSDLVSSLIIILYAPAQNYFYNSMGISSIFITAIIFASILFVCTLFMHWFAVSHDSFSRKLKRFYQSHRNELPILYVPCKEITTYNYKQAEI